MTKKDKAISLLNENNGYISSKIAHENGIDRKTLWRMVKLGLIERVLPGLYINVDIFPDPFFIVQHRCPKGIFSHNTALYLHGFSDRSPIKYMMTIPTGWSTKLLADKSYIFYYNRPELIKLGQTEVQTVSDNTVKVFDIERTICDCLRYIDRLDRNLVLTGLKRYLKSDKKDSLKLLEYATKLNIRETVHRYLEVI